METINRTRYYTLDALRGLAIVAMVLYHGLWDLVNIYHLPILWFGSTTAFVVQRCIRWCFVLLAGFCFWMGRRPWKRGLLTLGCGAVITLVSLVVLPETPIHFGVLTLIGAAAVLTALLHRWMQKIHPYIGLTLCLGLFLLTVDVELGYLGPWRLPRWMYADRFTALLGFPYTGFYSSDYVPLIPWLFAYWIGYFSYGIFEKHRWLDALTLLRCRPLEFLGRHSLLIYMLHQPIVYAFLFLIFA